MKGMQRMRSRQAVRKIFWHGTSSTNLRSILKQGLLPSGTVAVYDDELGETDSLGSRSYKTYGGVYITPQFNAAYTSGYKAKAQAGGNHVMIAVDYETRSPNVLIDEDSLFKFVEYTTKVVGTSGLLEKPPWRSLLAQYGDRGLPGLFYVSKFPQIVRAITNADLSDLVKKFLVNLIEWFPRIASRCKMQDSSVVAHIENVLRKSAFHLIDVAHRQAGRDTLTRYHENAVGGDVALHQAELDALQVKPPAELQGTFNQLRKAVGGLSLSFKEICDVPKYGPHSIRVMEPIRFRGKNKILCAIESIPHQSKETGVQVWDVVIRYCRDRKMLKTYLEQVPYTTYRVIDWQGKVKQTVFDEYYGWPTDVWGKEGQVRTAYGDYDDDDYEDVGMTEEGFWGNAGSGILFTTGEKILLLKRSPYVLEPGTWGIPGGAIPESHGQLMDARKSAEKETREELGSVPGYRIVDKFVLTSGSFTFTTYIARVKQEFKPRLNWENDRAEWVTEADAARKNLHPGVKALLNALTAEQVFDRQPKQLSLSDRWGTASERIAKRYLRRVSHRREAARKMFWHGTSSKNLRGILKQGMIPFGTDLVFEGETGEVKRSLGTFGGVYISDQWMTAYSAGNTAWRKKGGHLLMVGCTYETRTPTALPDEDDIIHLVEWATRMGSASDITSLNSPFGDALYEINRSGSYRPGGFDPSKYPQIIEAIQATDIASVVDKFKELLLRDYPRLGRRLKLQQAKIDPALENLTRAFTLQLLETSWHSSKDRLLEKAEESRASSYSYYDDDPERLAEALEQYAEEIKLIKNPPAGMRGTFALMRDATTKLSRILKETTDESTGSFRHNLRIMEPITYRGKNRILCVVEQMEQESAEILDNWDKPQRYTTIRFDYGADPSMVAAFVKPYQERVGGVYRVVNRTGKLLTLHLQDFKGNDLPWPTDLWGRKP